jgi:hypothetical protein
MTAQSPFHGPKAKIYTTTLQMGPYTKGKIRIYIYIYITVISWLMDDTWFFRNWKRATLLLKLVIEKCVTIQQYS